MDLFLIRHGETDENAAGIIQSWMDTNLNERGKRQAERAAATFNEPIDAIYCSDLQRAKQTATAFRNKYPNMGYIEDWRLRERNFGKATGGRHVDYDWASFWDPEDTIAIAGAETLKQYDIRVQEFLDDIRQSAFRKVLVVTHSGTINRIQHLTSNNHQHTDHANSSVVHVSLL